VPALRNEVVPFPVTLQALLLAICDALAGGGAGESALHIKDALIAGQVNPRSLLGVSFARNQKAPPHELDPSWLFPGSDVAHRRAGHLAAGPSLPGAPPQGTGAREGGSPMGRGLLPMLRILAGVHRSDERTRAPRRGARRRRSAASLFVLRRVVGTTVGSLRVLPECRRAIRYGGARHGPPGSPA